LKHRKSIQDQPVIPSYGRYGLRKAKRQVYQAPVYQCSTNLHIENENITLGKEVSVWVFDKVELSKRKVNNTNATIDKAIVEQIYQIMKKDMTALREICNSSGGVGNIVHYLETIEETTAMLIFTTEPILCSLADLQSGFEGIMPSLKLEDMKRENFNGSSYDKSSTALTDIEISRGILNISEGLQYLHTVQRKLHLNLTPESIVITQSGQWKLCGLGFCLGFQPGERQVLPSPYFLQSIPNVSTMRLEPDLRYCGPELTIGGLNPPGIRYLSPSSDVFSLGIIAYESYRSHLDKSLSLAERRTSIIPMSNNSAVYHPAALESISRLNYNFLSSSTLAQLIADMIQSAPPSRITIPNIMNHPYFSSGPLLVLKLIDSLKTRDVGTQSSQLLTLPSQLADIPERLLESTILPAICQATMSSIALFPFAIPTHIYVSQRILRSKYCAIAGASVVQAFESTTSVEVMQALLKHLPFFQEAFSPKDAPLSISIESAIVTLISNCLDKAQTSVHVSPPVVMTTCLF
jgi:SCY1-like protein 2